jgi:hypothetical protein
MAARTPAEHGAMILERKAVFGAEDVIEATRLEEMQAHLWWDSLNCPSEEAASEPSVAAMWDAHFRFLVDSWEGSTVTIGIWRPSFGNRKPKESSAVSAAQLIGSLTVELTTAALGEMLRGEFFTEFQEVESSQRVSLGFLNERVPKLKFAICVRPLEPPQPEPADATGTGRTLRSLAARLSQQPDDPTRRREPLEPLWFWPWKQATKPLLSPVMESGQETSRLPPAPAVEDGMGHMVNKDGSEESCGWFPGWKGKSRVCLPPSRAL